MDTNQLADLISWGLKFYALTRSKTFYFMELVLTAKEVMEYLKISENTLLRLEQDGEIVPDFRLGNRKRYYIASLERQLKKLKA